MARRFRISTTQRSGKAWRCGGGRIPANISHHLTANDQPDQGGAAIDGIGKCAVAPSFPQFSNGDVDQPFDRQFHLSRRRTGGKALQRRLLRWRITPSPFLDDVSQPMNTVSRAARRTPTIGDSMGFERRRRRITWWSHALRAPAAEGQSDREDCTGRVEVACSRRQSARPSGSPPPTRRMLSRWLAAAEPLHDASCLATNKASRTGSIHRLLPLRRYLGNSPRSGLRGAPVVTTDVTLENRAFERKFKFDTRRVLQHPDHATSTCRSHVRGC